jgi:uncharacterized pyridoxal phosphate-containing UPF0001 family protein
MGMATNTSNQEQLNSEFQSLGVFYKKYQALNFKLQTLSMGMSSDYKVAINNGSNMIRVGSGIFGNRNYASQHA